MDRRGDGLLLQHEFGGSPEGDLIQATDSLSFLDVNGHLVTAWVTGGETSLANAIKKLDWMYERIKLADARELARPVHDRVVQAVRAEVGAPAV